MNKKEIWTIVLKTISYLLTALLGAMTQACTSFPL